MITNMDPGAYGGTGTPEYEENITAELEERDYYTAQNVFWVPVEARWQTLRDCAQLPPGTDLPWNARGRDTPEKMRSVGWLIDNAMEAIERENQHLKNVLNKDFARTQITSGKLAELIALFSDTNFATRDYRGRPLDLQSRDILGHVYEYFLGQFAQAEGKKGGQFYTPKSIVTLIVEMLRPFKGRVYDPAMGSGGFFVQSEKFIERDDYVECLVALPGQLFTNTQIPACIWLLTRDKRNGLALDKKKRDRRGQFLFIDARRMGYMKEHVLRDFTADDIRKIAETFHAWQQGENYADVPGFCHSATLEEVRQQEHVLTPGRYVGAAEQKDDGEPFAEKMQRLTGQLAQQFAESAKLEAEIKKNLARLGYEF